jgi:3-keto-disaccharide hydrolase
MKHYLAALFLCASAIGADFNQPGTYLDAALAGPDYADQGEYLNDWGGAQVIALGDSKFRLVIYKGGLPGAGWDGERNPGLEGKREGEQIVFAPSDNGFKHFLAKGVLKTVTTDGNEYHMNKTERTSPSMGAKPARGIILFDGSNTDAWVNAHVDENRKLIAAGTKTKQSFTNFLLHCEFLLPFKPTGRGQDRGNSGIYLQDRYEVQVLDSFGLKGENNECGGIYSQAKPSVNMCYPPLTWQTYDIDFTSAKFDDSGKKIKPAIVTVKHNGVTIHDKYELKDKTGGGEPEGPSGGPIQLQGHGNPVFYRNVWLVEK